MKKIKIFSNNLYALKTIWHISKPRVIHTAVKAVIGYFEWIFMSIFFLKYIINHITIGAKFSEIAFFILLNFMIFSTLSIYEGYYNSMVVPYSDNKIYHELYRKIYTKVQNVELECFEDANFYNRYTMALDGSATKMTKAVDNFYGIIFGAGASAVAFSTMALIDPFSVLFVLLPIIGNFLFGRLMNHIWSGRYTDNVGYNRKAEYVNRVMHLADYAKEIRCTSIYELMLKKYDESIEGNCKVVNKYSKKGILYTWAQNVTTFALVFEGIMIYAAYRTIVSKTMGLAELAIMFTAMSASSWILIGLFNNITEALKNGQFFEYYRSFMEYQEKIPEDQDGLIPSKELKSVEFRNVSFAYKDNKPIINNLSFKVSGKKICAIVGVNGGGKTTLIKLLLRLYDPTKGEILVNDINIKEYNLRSYRELFSVAFQDVRVFAMSLKDNVIAGREFENPEDIAINALKCADIWEKVESMPQGLDTQMTKEFDKNGIVLSGGEQQKLSVARAFASDAPIKVFDEPSSALDPIAEYNLYKGIMQHSKNHLSFFISHRLSSVKDADIIFVIENGEVIEIGSHFELIKKDGKYADMYNRQAQNYIADETYREKINEG